MFPIPLGLYLILEEEKKERFKTVDSYHQIAKQIADLNPDTIVITTPHTILYSDYFHISPGQGAEGNFERFGAKQVSFLLNMMRYL